VGHIARIREIRDVCNIWPENMKEGDHGRPGHRWEDSIKWFFKKCGGRVYWIYLAQGRVK
jgi:hypothetical protein